MSMPNWALSICGQRRNRSGCASTQVISAFTVCIQNRWPFKRPHYAKTRLRAYTDSKGPDHPTLSAESDQGLHSPLTESLDTIKCRNGQQRPGLYCAHAQADLHMWILSKFDGTVSLGAPDRMPKALIRLCRSLGWFVQLSLYASETPIASTSDYSIWIQSYITYLLHLIKLFRSSVKCFRWRNLRV